MPRKSTDLSLASDLIDRAKAVGINLSRAGEAGIEQEVRNAKAERWTSENKVTIEAYDARIEYEGLPCDAYRKW